MLHQSAVQGVENEIPESAHSSHRAGPRPIILIMEDFVFDRLLHSGCILFCFWHPRSVHHIR